MGENVRMGGQVIFVVVGLLLGACAADTVDYSSNASIQLFQQYLQINTTTYNNLTEAVEFWRSLANDAGASFNVYEYVEGFPVVVLKWEGTDSSLNSIMLNSHMDVVPATGDWTYPPFSGYIDDEGNIYGRGTQDMKSVSIQYFEAMKKIKENNVSLLRDVYMTLMPDEEVGAESGMIPFLKTEEFKAMNVGIELDEGTSYPLPVVAMFYQDKSVWQIQVDCYGVSAHGSTFPETNETATGKCRNVIDKFFEFRDEQYKIASTAPPNDASKYTSVNLNKMNAGTANNIIPSVVSLTFDIRLGTRVNENQFNTTLYQWIAEAGENITLTYIQQDPQSPATVANSSNPYWTAINDAATEVDIVLLPTSPPGSTDARFVRSAGYPAFGMSPMPNTPLLLHSVDEYIPAETFLKGIDFYEKAILNLASLPGNATSSESSVYLYTTTTD